MENKQSSERLPSFKGPRDLTLTSPTTSSSNFTSSSLMSTTATPTTASSSAVTIKPSTPTGLSIPRPLPTKRVFKPNIPPKRDSTRVPATVTSNQPPKPSSTQQEQPSSSYYGRGRGRGSTDRGNRGNSRGGRGGWSREYIQSGSVFAEGVGDPLSRKKSAVPTMRDNSHKLRNINNMRSSGGGSRIGGGGKSVSISQFMEIEKKQKQRESSAKDKVKVDSVKTVKVEDDDDEEEAVADGSDQTVDSDHDELSDLYECKDDPNVPVVLPLSYYTSKNDESAAVSSLLAAIENPPGVKIKTEKGVSAPVATTSSIMTQVTQELASSTLLPSSNKKAFIDTLSSDTIFLLNLPDQLPVLQPDNNLETNNTSNNNKLSNDLSTLPEGFIGKIQIYSNGTSKFVLGENVFEIEAGTVGGFRQDLVSIDIEERKLKELGPVTHKFMCTPDLQALIG